MATKLDAMPKRPGRSSDRPWHEWADGSVWKIKKDEDFGANLESMRTQLYGRARSMRMDAEVVVDKADQSITFRMIPWEYPWDEWLNGQEHTVETTEGSLITAQLHARAADRRMAVEITQDANTLTFRVVPKPPKEDEG